MQRERKKRKNLKSITISGRDLILQICRDLCEIIDYKIILTENACI